MIEPPIPVLIGRACLHGDAHQERHLLQRIRDRWRHFLGGNRIVRGPELRPEQHLRIVWRAEHLLAQLPRARRHPVDDLALVLLDDTIRVLVCHALATVETGRQQDGGK